MSSRPFDDEELDDEFEDDFEDFDEGDEDRFQSKSSSAPSARVGGAGLPSSTQRPPTPGGSVPSPIRSPNTPLSNPAARPQGGAPSGGGVQPFHRPGSPAPPSVSSSPGSTARPQGSAPSSSSSSPFPGGSRPATPGGSSSSGSAAFSTGARPPAPGSSPSPLSGGGSSASSPSSHSSASSPAKKDEGARPSPGGFGSGRDDNKASAKPDDKNKGGGLGGLFNRGSDKNTAPSSSSRPAVSGQSAAKKDDKGGGGGPLGKIGGLFGGKKDGQKGDNKAAPKPPSSGSSPYGSSSSSFTSSSTSSSNRPFNSGGSGGSSGLGASSSYAGTGTKPGNSAPAKAGGGKKADSGGGALGRLRGLFSQKKQPSKNARAAREGRTIEVRPISLGADKTLEIIGMAIAFIGGVMLLASLSPSPGSLIDNINNFVSRLFGWGAVAIPIAMIPIGVWLITLRVGQETPSVDVTRIVGLILLFLCVLTAMQFFDALSYPPGENQSYTDYMAALRNVLLPLSSEFGRGGGRIGGEFYYQLVSNFSELAGFVLLVGVLLIALMLTFSISAQEVIAILIGNWRNMRDAFHRRSVRVRAQRAEKVAALAATAGAGSGVTISRPEVEALPMPAAGASPALPAGTVQQPLDLSRTEERSIPITMGGRTFKTPINAEAAELVSVGPSERAVAPAPASASGVSAAPEKTAAKEESAKTGLFGRIRSAAPIIGAVTVGTAVAAAKVTADALTPDSETAINDRDSDGSKAENSRFSGIGGRLFNRSAKPVTDASEKSVDKSAEPTLPAAAKPENMPNALTASSIAADAPIAPEKPHEAAPARLGDLARSPSAATPAGTQSGVRPFAKPESPVQSNPSARQGSPESSVLPGGNDPLRPASVVSNGQSAAQSAPAAATSERNKTGESAVHEKSADSAPMPTGNRSATPMQPVRSTANASRNPFHGQNADDEDDEAEFSSAKTGESGDDWSRLPPAKPKMPGSAPEAARPDTSSPAAQREPLAPTPASPAQGKPSDAAKPHDESIPDLQTRLQALRNMQAATSQKPAVESTPAPQADEQAKDKTEEKGGANIFKAAGIVAAGAVGAAVNKLTKSDDEVVLERPPAVVLPGPERRPPSAAFGKPDDGIRDPDGAMATSRPLPGNSPRPFTPVPGGDRPPTPVSTPPAASHVPPAQPAQPPAVQPVQTSSKTRKEFRIPVMSELLSSGMDQELDKTALVRRAKTIEETLSSFGAPGRVVEVRTGPVITQFGVEPDYVEGRGGKKARVKVSAIAALDKDLQLTLGAKSIRIEAPVPGKGYVGIEVPNEKPAVVKLRDVMESQEFRKIQSPLAIALGQGVDGTPVAADLASMPHLLIAGTTGSGKSVCVNTIIASLLLRNSPDRVKLIMVDPKRVELTGYNGIPHLVAPVVVELERIVSVLKWVTREMDERYRRFALASARNIEDYNKHLPSGDSVMPYIVVIIDELADLMMLAPDETEKVITRLAALARATGIHLVIATQRPSVDVVTGLIKANFPARIAFAVAGGVDSRVILDQPGAERLLGRGDMLYMSGDAPAPVRLQGVYVSDTEINNMTRFWRNQMSDADMAQAGKPLISQFALDEMSAKEGKDNGSKMKSSDSSGTWDSRSPTGHSVFGHDDSDDAADNDDDELYEQAVDLVRRQNKASVSLLQRRFRIGYTRAARLMDVLEERGIVGPPVEGAKPREVLPSR